MVLRSVLVATDLSRGSSRAFRRVAKLPLAGGALVTIVHVLAAGRLRRDAEGAAERVADREAAAIRASHPDVRVKITIRRGVPYEELLRACGVFRPDLVVGGRHGGGGFAERLIGSTIERVVRDARVPVLVVTRDARRPYGSLVTAIESPDAAAARVLRLGVAVSGPAVTDRWVVHALDQLVEHALRRAGVAEATIGSELRDRRRTVARRIRAWLAKVAPAAGGSWHVAVRAGEPRAVILDVLGRSGCELVVLGTHARKGVRRFLLGSVAEGVLRSATSDVLLVPPSPQRAAR